MNTKVVNAAEGINRSDTILKMVLVRRDTIAVRLRVG